MPPPAEGPAAAPGPPPSLPLMVRGFFVLLGTLPWWIPVARGRLPLGEMGAALDRVFVTICHRIPERSLALSGVQMPVCSRCAGIFAGIALGAALARPRLPMSVWRPALIAAGALMVADIVTQDLGLRPVWHPARIATGIALGYGMAVSFVTQVARRS